MSARPPAPQEPESKRELATSRLIEAPRERVFAALSDPARLARWWGPKGFRNTFQEFDLRPGGRWVFVMHGPDGRDYPNQSVFVEVKPPKRVVLRHVSSPRFEMTITFEDERGRTRVGSQDRQDAESQERPEKDLVGGAKPQAGGFEHYSRVYRLLSEL